MSKTLLRGLDLIELVGLDGPMTISEIARRTGIDVSIVSRTVAACEPDGWLSRADGRIAAGPRCALLGLASPATHAIRAAEPLVRAISAAVGPGLAVSASALVGREVMVLAVEAGAGAGLAVGVPSRVPVHLLADGLAIAAQLSPAQLEKALGPEPYASAEALAPDPARGSAIAGFVASFPGSAHPEPQVTRTRAELDARIAQIRREGFSRDAGRIHPSIHCIARPWPAAGLPSAISCVGSHAEITLHRPLIEACLTAATEPGGTSPDIIRAAASAA
jgi:DNA-binding IclR family transcriptional regulator